MNPRLDKLKNRNLISSLVAFLLLVAFASIVPAIRPYALNILEYPLRLVGIVKREVKGVVFYHRNLLRNEALLREVGFLKQKLDSLGEIYLESQRLNNLLGLKQKAPYKLVAARVIGRCPDSWLTAVIINKGSHHGIRRGQVVIGFDGLAGKVAEASAFSSKVILLNDPTLAVSAIVQRSRLEGLVTGALGSSVIMKYLPKDADIRPGDIILTSGLTDMYPKGLRIGEVVDTQEEFSGLGRYALVRPAVELSGLEEALVIVP